MAQASKKKKRPPPAQPSLDPDVIGRLNSLLGTGHLDKDLTEVLESLEPDEQETYLEALEERAKIEASKRCRSDLMEYMWYMWPAMKTSWHHELLCRELELLEATPGGRLKLHLPPRSTKSESASVFAPTWCLGRNPNWMILQFATNHGLAEKFGRAARALIENPKFQDIFPGMRLDKMSRAANRWHTVHEGTFKRGEYFCLGAGASSYGRGGDWIGIDDPHNEKEITPEFFEAVYNWYTTIRGTRVQPGGRICLTMSRWGLDDLSGRLEQDEIAGKDEWRPVVIPAQSESSVSEDNPGGWYWHTFWPAEEMEAKRRSMDLTPWKWAAQYQQDPISQQKSAIPRDRWMQWRNPQLPMRPFHVLQSWDTAFTEKTKNSASACTTWGVFWASTGPLLEDTTELSQGAMLVNPNVPKEQQRKVEAHVILMHAWQGHLEFPQLKQMAKHLALQYRPNEIIIEAKASGIPLFQELRRMGLSITNNPPAPTEDKYTRLHAVADLFASRKVWVPVEPCAETIYPDWANPLLSQMERGPGLGDDLLDSATQALIRFRRGGFIKSALDEEPKREKVKRQRIQKYW